MKCGEWLKNAKHKILIQKQNLVADDYGGADNTWVEVAKVYAWIKPLNIHERFINAQLQSSVTHKMVIRYMPELKDTKETGSYRIRFDNRTFSIAGIKNLDNTLRNYGRNYQELQVDDNGPEID